MAAESLLVLSKVMAVLMLAAFLPLTGIGYYFFRRHQRQAVLERIFEKLSIRDHYQSIYVTHVTGWHFVLSVGFATIIAAFGLAVLLFGRELGFAERPSILLGGAEVLTLDGLPGEPVPAPLVRYQQGALLVFGLGFLGAYLWGLQMLVRRYTVNDLIPAAYYHMALRMIFAAVVALILYHTADGARGLEGAVFGQHLLPAVAFLVGMFPQRGLHWINQRVRFLAPRGRGGARELPLDLIEGLSRHDRMRLEELGIDSCYDLAAADFVPLVLRLPYGARELIDWLLQAKLCVQIGDGVQRLRGQGIRLITDLARMEDAELGELADVAQVPLFALRHARDLVCSDPDIDRLQAAARILGEYWDRDVDLHLL